MKYVGGKSILGRKIAGEIKFYRRPNQIYLEPFCGALGVLRHVPGPRIASDANRALVTLYQCLQVGWQPPTYVDKQTFLKLKQANDLTDPMTAYVGIGMCYMGSWFSHFCEHHGVDGKTKRTLHRDISLCADVIFEHRCYSSYQPNNMIIYCDPPYANTWGYPGAGGSFDHNEFWNVMRDWSKTNTVLISELVAPEDFQPIATYAINRRSHGSMRTEHVFKWRRP
jgi:DNA adenine methylase